MEWSHNRKKRWYAEKGMKEIQKQSQHSYKKKRREREVKIRKNTVVYWKQTHVGWLNGFPCSLSLGWPSTSPCCPAMLSHAAKTWISKQAEHEEPLGGVTFSQMPEQGAWQLILPEAASWFTIQMITIYLKYQPKAEPSPDSVGFQAKQWQGMNYWCLHCSSYCSIRWSPSSHWKFGDFPPFRAIEEMYWGETAARTTGL